MSGACSVYRAKSGRGRASGPHTGTRRRAPVRRGGRSVRRRPAAQSAPADLAREGRSAPTPRPTGKTAGKAGGRTEGEKKKRRAAGPTKLGMGRDVPAAKDVGNPAGGIFRGAGMQRGGASRNLPTAHAVANSGEPPK